MSTAFFISHPEVVIDPNVPVPRWHITEAGIGRMRVFAGSPAVRNVASIWASRETKAIEAAGILAGALGLSVLVEARLGENDRSATGFLPGEEFLRVVEAFFADPDTSVRGWETARDAQARVVAAIESCLAAAPPGDVAFVAHGGVGTLALCHFLGAPISQSHGQPSEGHFWAFDIGSRKALHGWKPIAPK